MGAHRDGPCLHRATATEGRGWRDGGAAQKSPERDAQGPRGVVAHSDEGENLSMTREHKARKNEMGLERERRG